MKCFEEMKGKTLTLIEGGIGDEEMMFETSEGEKCYLYHDQD